MKDSVNKKGRSKLIKESGERNLPTYIPYKTLREKMSKWEQRRQVSRKNEFESLKMPFWLCINSEKN